MQAGVSERFQKSEMPVAYQPATAMIVAASERKCAIAAASAEAACEVRTMYEYRVNTKFQNYEQLTLDGCLSAPLNFGFCFIFQLTRLTASRISVIRDVDALLRVFCNCVAGAHGKGRRISNAHFV